MIRLLKSDWLWLLVILSLALILRLYKLDSPIADWHSWRQADTAAVSRNFFKEGYNPLLPKYDDMSTVSEILKPNPQRYRFVEFPVYNTAVYLAYVVNNGVDERLARLVSILASLGSIIFIYFLVKKYFDTLTGFLSALLFATLPYAVFYSRVILPEPSLVFFSLAMVYFTDKWIYQGGQKLYFISLFSAILALLTKPYAIFYMLPLAYSVYKKEGSFLPLKFRYLAWIIPVSLPLLAWRFWISQYPEGIPASTWLFNGNGIRFRPAFWRWLVVERLGKEILSVTGASLFFIGFLKKPKVNLFLHFLALSSFIYLVVLATGNVQHDYYQYFIIPGLAIFMARGLAVCLRGGEGFLPRIITAPLGMWLVVISLLLTSGEVKGLYQINNPVIVEAGIEADRILPKDAVVVAPYNGDTAFLYQTNRHGLPVVTGSFEDMRKQYGVTHLVSVNFDQDTNTALKNYRVLEVNKKFAIVDLTQKNAK